MSIDTCKLFVKGRPGATHGRLTKDREGTVRSFIVDIGQLYSVVYKHVRKCPTCDPNEVLRAYLDNRNAPHKGGLLSDGLIRLADQYSRIPGKRVDSVLLREFTWRTWDFDALINNPGILPSECVMGLALNFRFKSWKLNHEDRNRKVHGVYNRFCAEDAVLMFARTCMRPLRRRDIAMETARIFDREGDVWVEHPSLRDFLVVADVLSI